MWFLHVKLDVQCSLSLVLIYFETHAHVWLKGSKSSDFVLGWLVDVETIIAWNTRVCMYYEESSRFSLCPIFRPSTYEMWWLCMRDNRIVEILVM